MSIRVKHATKSCIKMQGGVQKMQCGVLHQDAGWSTEDAVWSPAPRCRVEYRREYRFKSCIKMQCGVQKGTVFPSFATGSVSVQGTNWARCRLDADLQASNFIQNTPLPTYMNSRSSVSVLMLQGSQRCRAYRGIELGLQVCRDIGL